MPLLEIVRIPARATRRWRPRGTSAAGSQARSLVADAPGFVVNRVLTRFLRSLLDALEHGATADEVDEPCSRSACRWRRRC